MPRADAAPLGDGGPPWQAPEGFWPGLLDGIAEAVVAVDLQGVVRSANVVAQQLLPIVIGKVVDGGGALPEALRSEANAFEIDHDDRRLHGRKVALSGLSVWYVRDVTEQTMRVDALLAERWRSAFLAEASRRLSGSLNRDRVARTATLLAVPALGDCAIVFLPGSRGRTLWYRFAGEAGEEGNVHGVIEAGGLPEDSPITEGLAGLPVGDDPRLVEHLRWLLPKDFSRTGSALLLPLPGHAQPAGVLAVVRSAGRAGFEPVEQHLIRQFAVRTGSAIASAALYTEQAQTADLLQASLLPEALPELDEVAFGAAYRAARERLRIGGDFYDVFAGPDGHWTFLLGDVCGKGVEAAVHTGQARQTVHALRLLESRPAKLLELLNQAVFSRERPQLTTLVIGSVRPSPRGGLDIALASGGHPAPFVVRSDGRVEEVEVSGLAIGVVPVATFVQVAVRLEPGDSLVAYSDGVTEARGGPTGLEFYGPDRLASVLANYAGAPAAAMAQRIEQTVGDWLGGREHDDIAVLVIQAKPAHKRRHLVGVPNQ
ncbi:PP2C family protein-serine/threonine phosphatase [Rhizocola hellebori]|uniref:PP2C family protein-serine/threonine phosphatase n=1 Tax=Rhizocola hellebori TaxID=1392758 RepID=UPI001942D962|nr:SpoIIE family protein phosphatase [Rhizocola hellebori]